MKSLAATDYPAPVPIETVLIVDDDPVNIRMLLEILEQDYRVLVAREGQQALKLLEKHQDIDLLLLDVDMPGMSGFEVLARIRELSILNDLPVILVTGRNQEDDEVFGLEQGAADYIAKPVSAAIVKARVRTQIKLAHAKADLEKKNQELQRALMDTNAAKNELAQFTAMVSHELRTPVAILLCETELLVDGIREPSRKNLESLHEELKHFSGLINDLFDLVMSEASSLKYEKLNCNVAQLLERSCERFLPQFQDAGLKISIDTTPIAGLQFHADPQRLRQVIDNLFKNTLRYTDAEGRLEITTEQNQHDLLIHFQDSAPGVNESDMNKLFERLYRVDKSRNRSTGGAGLGLAVCETIVRGHGGEISARQSPLGGLWITLKLPLNPDQKNDKGGM